MAAPNVGAQVKVKEDRRQGTYGDGYEEAGGEEAGSPKEDCGKEDCYQAARSQEDRCQEAGSEEDDRPQEDCGEAADEGRRGEVANGQEAGRKAKDGRKEVSEAGWRQSPAATPQASSPERTEQQMPFFIAVGALFVISTGYLIYQFRTRAFAPDALPSDSPCEADSHEEALRAA